MKKAFSEIGVIIGLLLGIIIFTSLLILIPTPIGTIKNSLKSLFSGVSNVSKSFEEESKSVNANKIIWIINDYLLPYSNDGTSLAALSYQLAYQLGLISYRDYQNYVNSFNVPTPIGENSLICCEIKKGDCLIFLDSDRSFCMKMDGITHESECRIYLKLSKVYANALYVILDSPFPIKDGNDAYFIPVEYSNFLSISGSIIENLDDVMQMLLEYPTYYCIKGDTPSDIKRIFPNINKQYTVYRYAGTNQFAFCSPSLRINCNKS